MELQILDAIAFPYLTTENLERSDDKFADTKSLSEANFVAPYKLTVTCLISRQCDCLGYIMILSGTNNIYRAINIGFYTLYGLVWAVGTI